MATDCARTLNLSFSAEALEHKRVSTIANTHTKKKKSKHEMNVKLKATTTTEPNKIQR